MVQEEQISRSTKTESVIYLFILLLNHTESTHTKTVYAIKHHTLVSAQETWSLIVTRNVTLDLQRHLIWDITLDLVGYLEIVTSSLSESVIYLFYYWIVQKVHTKKNSIHNKATYTNLCTGNETDNVIYDIICNVVNNVSWPSLILTHSLSISTAYTPLHQHQDFTRLSLVAFV